jgi:hypothetical protein
MFTIPILGNSELQASGARKEVKESIDTKYRVFPFSITMVALWEVLL